MSAPAGSVPTSPASLPPHGGNGAAPRGLTDHRLADLERRMAAVEGKVEDLRNQCTRIETKLDGMAGKSYVLWLFVGAVSASILSIVGHLLVRTIAS